MTDKQEALTRLRETFDLWQAFLDNLPEAEITAPPSAGGASIKEVIAHLRGWQQRSIARLEAAELNQAPVFPPVPAELAAVSEDDVDRLNAWFYETARPLSWPQVRQAWQAGFERFLALGAALPEPDLTAPGQYAWLDGEPLLLVLQASYEHHEEHLHPLLLAWLRRPPGRKTAG
jgi:hypothetical protein